VRNLLDSADRIVMPARSGRPRGSRLYLSAAGARNQSAKGPVLAAQSGPTLARKGKLPCTEVPENSDQ
jgi:hypothetical protein